MIWYHETHNYTFYIRRYLDRILHVPLLIQMTPSVPSLILDGVLFIRPFSILRIFTMFVFCCRSLTVPKAVTKPTTAVTTTTTTIIATIIAVTTTTMSSWTQQTVSGVTWSPPNAGRSPGTRFGSQWRRPACWRPKLDAVVTTAMTAAAPHSITSGRRTKSRSTARATWTRPSKGNWTRPCCSRIPRASRPETTVNCTIWR